LPGLGFSVSARKLVKASSHQASRRCFSVGEVSASIAAVIRAAIIASLSFGVQRSSVHGSAFRVRMMFEVLGSRFAIRDLLSTRTANPNVEPQNNEPGTGEP
jgi:hypothetical protein